MKNIEVPMTIELDREDDGRWMAEAVDYPGVMAYGVSPGEAVQRCVDLVADRTPAKAPG